MQRPGREERAAHGDITIKIYPGATRDFDDPGASHRDVPAKAAGPTARFTVLQHARNGGRTKRSTAAAGAAKPDLSGLLKAPYHRSRRAIFGSLGR
jgi:hypothetical protein